MGGAKRNRKSNISLLEEFFGKYPGSELVSHLGKGASLRAGIGREVFSIEKTESGVSIERGDAGSPDISVALDRATLEYLAASKDPADLVQRARRCLSKDHGKYRMEYSIEAGIPKLLSKGYLSFARRMGIL